jgi:hypothetical protein
MTAYNQARAATPPQKGLTYSELLIDNIIGLDNDYLSAGEQVGQAFNADELGFLKNAGLSAFEGAKKAVTQPITTAEELLSGVFDSVENLAAEDLDARLKRMYGVGFDQATPDQVTSAREAVFGDAITASGLIPGGAAIKKGLDLAIDPIQRRQAATFFRETGNPTFNPEAAANARFFYPSFGEVVKGSASNDPELGAYADKALDAEKLLKGGASPESVLNATGIMPVPIRSTTGLDAGFRLVLPTDDQGIAALRPNSPYNIKTTLDPSLTENEYGNFGPSNAPGAGPMDYEIRLNPQLDQAATESTYRHERTHGDLMEGEIGWNELGMNPQSAYSLQQDALLTLDDLISSTTDVTEKADYGKLRDELKKMTSFELYTRNPGEMLARLSQGDATMAKRLSALQLLNPYINPTDLMTRMGQSFETAIRSETRPYMRALKARFPGVESFDVHAPVPMDMNKAIINDPGFVVENQTFIAPPNNWNGLGDPWEGVDEIPPSFPNRGDDIPFARGGVVWGSYLDNDPYD